MVSPYSPKAKPTINEHIKNIFAEGELVEGEVMKKFGISEFQQKALLRVQKRGIRDE